MCQEIETMCLTSMERRHFSQKHLCKWRHRLNAEEARYQPLLPSERAQKKKKKTNSAGGDESEVKVLVAQSCLTFCNPVNCSPTKLLCPWDSPGKNTGVGSHSLLQGIFPTQGWDLGLLHCRQILYRLSHRSGWYGERNQTFGINIYILVYIK